MGFEVSDVSASYTAHLDPQPLLLLIPLSLPCHDSLVFLLELGVLVVDQHGLEKWPCLLHLKQTDDAAGHSQLDVKFHMQYIQSLVHLDVQLGTAEAFLYYYNSWALTLGVTL